MQALINELTNDPLERGYAGMTDSEAHASLHTPDRPGLRDAMSGDEIFQQTDPTGFVELTDAKRNLWLAFCGRDVIDPRATANVDFVKWVFGDTAQTVANLATARQTLITRVAELGITATLLDVIRARRESA